MSIAIMQEFVNHVPYGLPVTFQGEGFEGVSREVVKDLLNTASATYATSVMLKWFDGKVYADSIGSFSIREYDGPIGSWTEWTYTA